MSKVIANLKGRDKAEPEEYTSKSDDSNIILKSIFDSNVKSESNLLISVGNIRNEQ